MAGPFDGPPLVSCRMRGENLVEDSGHRCSSSAPRGVLEVEAPVREPVDVPQAKCRSWWNSTQE